MSNVCKRKIFCCFLVMLTLANSNEAEGDHEGQEQNSLVVTLKHSDSDGYMYDSLLNSSVNPFQNIDPDTQIAEVNVDPDTQMAEASVDPEISQLQVEYGNCRALNLLEVLVGVTKCSINHNTGLPYSLDIEDGLLIKSDYDKFTKKIKCVPRKLEENETAEARVQLVNSSHLFEKLGSKNDTRVCAVVLFYAPWCMFCAETAPHYNALARAFTQIDVLAIDAVNFSDLRSRFGTIAVPNILVFHNSKAVARYNSSERTLENIVSFVANITGLEPNRSVTLLPDDYEGPLSSVATDDADILLWVSWIFILICLSTAFTKSSVFQKLKNYLGLLGNIEHQHID